MPEVKVTKVFVDERQPDEAIGEILVQTKAPIEDENGNTTEVRVSTHVLNLGTNLASAVNMYGESAVFDMWAKQAKVDFQNTSRRLMKSGRLDEVSTLPNEWRPGQGLKADVMQAAKAAMAEMSKEEQDEATIQLLVARGMSEAQARKILGVPNKAK